MFKKFTFVYRKPNHYYPKFFTFLVLCSFLLALTHIKFNLDLKNIFIFIINFLIYFLILIILFIIIELFERGDYITPLEIYEIERFVNKRLNEIKKGDNNILKHINKYNPSVKQIKIFLKKRKKFTISTILKKKDNYIINLIDEKKWLLFFLCKFLSYHSIHKIVLKKNKKNYKIIYFK